MHSNYSPCGETDEPYLLLPRSALRRDNHDNGRELLWFALKPENLALLLVCKVLHKPRQTGFPELNHNFRKLAFVPGADGQSDYTTHNYLTT